MANNKSTTGRTRKPSGVKKNLKQPIPIDTITSSPQISSISINPGNIAGAPVHPEIQEEIRRRAYELYEQRGRQEGFHAEDWVRAETEILIRYNKKEKKEQSA
jgi:hypothetical protein